MIIDKIKNIILQNLITKNVPIHMLDMKRDYWEEPTIHYVYNGRIIEQISIEGSFKYNDWNSWYKLNKIMSENELKDLYIYLEKRFKK